MAATATASVGGRAGFQLCKCNYLYGKPAPRPRPLVLSRHRRWHGRQAALDRRANWTRFGDAATERASDCVTAQSTDEVAFERLRPQKQTQEVGGRAAVGAGRVGGGGGLCADCALQPPPPGSGGEAAPVVCCAGCNPGQLRARSLKRSGFEPEWGQEHYSSLQASLLRLAGPGRRTRTRRRT